MRSEVEVGVEFCVLESQSAFGFAVAIEYTRVRTLKMFSQLRLMYPSTHLKHSPPVSFEL